MHRVFQFRDVNPERYLLIDASSPISVCAGILDNRTRTWCSFSEEKAVALEGIFSALKKVCASPAGDEIRGFLFCEGPGSILGIRIAAAAIRARLALARATVGQEIPVWAYSGLRLAAYLILRAFPQERTFVVAAESRMNTWNILRVRNGVPEENFSEIKTAECQTSANEKIFILPHRRTLPPALSSATPCPVLELLKNDPAVFTDVPGLLHDCGNTPDAVNTSDVNSYARWTPERHRGN